MAVNGQTILIVGGASGIGRETARKLRTGEIRIVVADRDSAGLADLEKEPGPEIDTLVMDMTDPEMAASALRWIDENIGQLDILIMCAAIHGTCPIEYMSDAQIDAIVNVNLISHVKFVRDTLPLMNDGGRIIGVSSNSAGIGIPMEAVYAASKAALERVYEGLSIELGYRRIKPIIIQPGNVNTGFNERGNDYSPRGNAFVDEGYQRVVSAIDSQHGIDPGVVADVIIRAVVTSRPRFRYLVGMNARKSHWAKRLLGTGLALRLLARFFGF